LQLSGDEVQLPKIHEKNFSYLCSHIIPNISIFLMW